MFMAKSINDETIMSIGNSIEEVWQDLQFGFELTDDDFEVFDLLITMDWDNRALLEERSPAMHRHKIRGFTEFLQTSQASAIPDPYYGGDQGFEHVLDLVEEASDGLIKTLIMKAPQ